jgi:hypothetical protein
MAIVVECYQKNDKVNKTIQGDKFKTNYEKTKSKIDCIKDMFEYLDSIGKLPAFVRKEYPDGIVYFAVDLNQLYPYRNEMLWSGIPNAAEIVDFILINNHPVCKYSGATQLTSPMITYRKNGWNVGSSCEIDLVSDLATPYAEYIRNIREERGIREAIRELFNICLE